jgi:hypothetical protein
MLATPISSLGISHILGNISYMFCHGIINVRAVASVAAGLVENTRTAQYSEWLPYPTLHCPTDRSWSPIQIPASTAQP